MSPHYGVVSGCSALCLVCFFFVLFVEATHAVPSLTKCDRCFINATHAVGGTVLKLLNFGLQCTTNDVRCFIVFSVTSRLLVRIWMRAFSFLTQCQPPRRYLIGLLFSDTSNRQVDFCNTTGRRQKCASKVCVRFVFPCASSVCVKVSTCDIGPTSAS